MSGLNKVYTITFGDVAENHAKMQKIGTLHENGYSIEKLQQIQTKLTGLGLTTEMVDLNDGFQEGFDQAKVLDAMMKILDQPGGGERVMAFLNVLGRGETALLKKSTGFPRYEAGDLSKVLTPEQMKVVDDAASQMTRNIRISDQAATGREAMRDILSENMAMLRLPSLINYKVAATNSMLGP
jgi:hypothetical protein